MLVYVFWEVFFLTGLYLRRAAYNKLYMQFSLLCITIFVGSRDAIGGDWHQYLLMYERNNIFWQIFFEKDIGFSFISYLANLLGLNFYCFNLLIASLSSWLIYKAFSSFKYSSRVLVILFPVVFVVLGMNLTRQFLALSFIFFALNFVLDNKNSLAFILILLATAIHKSAFLLLGIFVVTLKRKFLRIIVVIFCAILFWGMVLYYREHLYSVFKFYELYSGSFQGFMFRATPIIWSCIIIFIGKNEIFDNVQERLLISSLILLFGVVIFVSLVSSEAADRFAYYFVYIPCFTLLRVHRITMRNSMRIVLVLFLALYYLIQMITWLLYGAHAAYWLPYRSILFT